MKWKFLYKGTIRVQIPDKVKTQCHLERETLEPTAF